MARAIVDAMRGYWPMLAAPVLLAAWWLLLRADTRRAVRRHEAAHPSRVEGCGECAWREWRRAHAA